MRRRRDLQPAPHQGAMLIDEVASARRYTWLGRWLLCAPPIGAPADMCDTIRARKAKLDGSAAPIPQRLAVLEALIAELGLDESARDFVDRQIYRTERAVS